jgi:hypothetical protein
MNIAIPDDHIDTLTCFNTLAGHDVTVWRDHTDDVDVLADRLAAAEVLVLIRERSRLPGDVHERPPTLRLSSQQRSRARADRGVHPPVPPHRDDHLLFAADRSRQRIPPR